MIIKTFYLKSMICNSCIKTITYELNKKNIQIAKIRLGETTIIFDESNTSDKEIELIFENLGFEVIKESNQILIEQIKVAVIELVHKANNMNSIIRNSDYLVEKLGYSYQYLSSVFSKNESKTLEQFIILHRIEKVKELISYKELSLSEISYTMGYRSVQYLSCQFKTITGVSIRDIKRII